MSPWLGDLLAELELLLGDGGDAGFRRQVDDRAHLGAEHAELDRPGEQLVEVRHRLHQADAVLFRFQPLIDLDDRDDAPVLPQVGRDRLALRLAVHRALEQDRGDDLVAVEGRRGDDAHPHLVHELEHLGVVALVFAVGNAVEAQRAGGRPAALVERGDEAGLRRHLRHHLLVGHGVILAFRSPRDNRAGSCNGADGTRASRRRTTRRIAFASTEAVRAHSITERGTVTRRRRTRAERTGLVKRSPAACR